MDVYKKSLEYNYYSRSDGKSISYSDGSEVEDKIFDIIKKTNDKSTLSDELVAAIDDWPTEYHFSKSRHCLLRPLPFTSDDSILELGCGCGAITRYLGETGADVDAVEGTHSRARIAGERSVDLDNVHIYVDNLLKFETEKKYDWVLFIGVLEYAPIFSKESDAIQHYLNEAKKFLKPNGKLVVAIENKLGLKYFNGCGEDHVNESYFGIENRYNETTPVTFGKEELSLELFKSGFENTTYYYPFPDYKLPNLILSEEAFNIADFNVGEILKGVSSRDYTGRIHRAFEESLVWPELARNKLVEQLSNSYLVVADNNKVKSKCGKLAWYYNTSRKKEYVTETLFTLDNYNVKVLKKTIVENNDNYKSIYLKAISEKYIEGDSIQTLVDTNWNKYKSYEALIEIYTSWFEYILTFSNYDGTNNKLSKLTLPGCYIDLTPFNIKSNSDYFECFDQEWSVNDEIPLFWLLFRGIYWSLHKINTTHEFKVDVTDFICQIIKSKGMAINEIDIEYVINKERFFVSWVTNSEFKFHNVVEKKPSKFTDSVDYCNYLKLEQKGLNEEIDALNKEVNLFRSSLYFRIVNKIKRILKCVES